MLDNLTLKCTAMTETVQGPKLRPSDRRKQIISDPDTGPKRFFLETETGDRDQTVVSRLSSLVGLVLDQCRRQPRPRLHRPAEC